MNSSVLWTPFSATTVSVLTQTTRKDLVRHSAGDLLLSGDAVWTQEHRSHLPKVGEPNVPEADRLNYGGIHR